MPSAIRASRSGRHLENGPNRTRTGQIDHDVFEGLPVRRWSRQPHTFSQAPKTDDSEFGVQGPTGTTNLQELPMPRDSQLLPAMSRALLRAARAGCIYIRSEGRAADENEKEAAGGEDQAGTASNLADRSFTSRRWMTLPKHMESAEVEFLAKRRPGLPSLYGATGAVDGSSATPAPMRKTKFKKVDKETGNISIYEAWVPEGHRLENEVTGDIQTIAEQSQAPVKAEVPAPGTVVDGIGIVNSEGVVVADTASSAVVNSNKRRPPPPKRKGKGIGKGRKKKVMFAPGEGADAATVHGAAPGTDGASREGQDASQMSVDQSGQDDDEDDGEDGDESDEGDESMVDAKTPETPQPPSGTESTDQPHAETSADQGKDVDMTDAAPEPSAAERQEAVSQPATAPTQGGTPKTDDDAPTSASVTPAPPAGQTEDTAQETSTESNAEPSAAVEEVPPKEESQAPEPAPVTDSHSAEAEKPSEVKAEPQPSEGPENVPATDEPSVSTPAEPIKEPEAEQPEAEVPAEVSAPPSAEQQEHAQAQDQGNTESNEGPVADEQQPADAEPAAAEGQTAVDSAEPPAPEPATADAPGPSGGEEPVPAVETKPEETPTAETGTSDQQELPASDSAPEEKKDGEPAPESS